MPTTDIGAPFYADDPFTATALAATYLVEHGHPWHGWVSEEAHGVGMTFRGPGGLRISTTYLNGPAAPAPWRALLWRSTSPTSCTSCGHEVDPLALFPGGLCLDCYRQTPDANRPITADELRAMWGGAPVRPKKGRL